MSDRLIRRVSVRLTKEGEPPQSLFVGNAKADQVAAAIQEAVDSVKGKPLLNTPAALAARVVAGCLKVSDDTLVGQPEQALADAEVEADLTDEAVTIALRPTQGRTKSPLFRGDTPHFVRWTAAYADLEKIVGRTVQFSYYHGEHPGRRTVKIERVANGAEPDTFVLAGLDLVHGVYRSFRVDRIDGEVRVVG
jgi:hypothetical protein